MHFELIITLKAMLKVSQTEISIFGNTIIKIFVEILE